jgi:hypothetical protein
MLAAIVLNLVSCANYACFDPAPNVAYVATDASYGTEAVMLDGVLYTGPTLSQSNGTVTADLRSADGRQIRLTASFRKWSTQVNVGRLHKTQIHLELLSGEIQP